MFIFRSNVNASNTLVLGLLTAVACASTSRLHGQMQAVAEQAKAELTVGFDQVQPILRKRCQSCHNPEELRGDLSVTDLTAIQAGSSSGPVVVPGKPRESMLYTTAAHLDEPTMPPNSRKIPGRELEILRRWIEDGLVAKSGDKPASAGASSEVAEKPPTEVSTMKESMPASKQDASGYQPIRPVLRGTSVTALAASEEGSMVALAGDHQVVFLDAMEGKLVHALPVDESEITALSFHRDGQSLLAAAGVPGLSGTLFGFDVKTGVSKFQALDENDSILALDWSPKGGLAAIGGPSKVLRLCEIPSGKVLHTLRKHTDWVLTTKFSPDGLLVASGDRFGGLYVWESATGKLFLDLKGHTGPIHSLAWDTEGDNLLSAGADGQIRLWNLHHGEQVVQWDAEVGGILALVRSDSLTLAAGRNGKVTAWRTPSDKVGEFEGVEQLEQLEVLADCKRAVTTDAEGQIHILSLPDLKPIASLSLPKRSGASAELLADLEQKVQAFDAVRLERLAMAEAQRKAQAESKPEIAGTPEALATKSDAIPGSLAPSVDDPVGTLAVAEAIALEMEQSKRMLERQTRMLQASLRQQEELKKQIEVLEALVVDGRQQVDRFQQLLDSLGEMKPNMVGQLIQEQAQEQTEILEALRKLKTRTESASRRALLLPRKIRPEWAASLALLDEISSSIEKQSESTQQKLQEFSSAPRSAVASATKEGATK